MTFRSRLTLTSAVAVAVAVAVVSVVIFISLRALLRGQVDEDLMRLARESVGEDQFGNVFLNLPPDPLGGSRGYGQLVYGDDAPVATLANPDGSPTSILPQTERAKRVALGLEPAYFTDLQVDGAHVRVYTRQISASPPTGIMVARPLDEIDLALRRFAFVLALVAMCGVGLAAGLGGLVARAALVPLRRIASSAERIATSRDPNDRIEAMGDDEVGRLAITLNGTLEALSSSLETQRRLVADASHELRTPLTSLRTNLEILGDAHQLSGSDRMRVIGSLVTQVDELTGLVSDLLELARGNEPNLEMESIRLDLLVAETAERAMRRFPAVRFELDLEPSTVRATPARIDRAVTNLINNAVKWSPEGEPISVTVRGNEVSVEDRGPGVPDEDKDRIFERFYRSPASRSKPGSGLGLAIVRQVAEAHGGKAWVESNGQGAKFRITF